MIAPMAARAHTEEREQARLVRWAHSRAVQAIAPQLLRLHHSPNGGRRDARTGAQMVAMGTKPGWPDLVLPLPGGSPPGLAIEMKSATGRASPEQSSWLAYLEQCGWRTAICRSAEDARAFLLTVLGIDPATAPPLDAPR